MDIQKWLTELELSQYFENFKNNDIDENTLFELTESDLKEIGINSLGHRKILIEEIKKIKPKQGIKKTYNKVSSPKIKPEKKQQNSQLQQNTIVAEDNKKEDEQKTIFIKGHSRIEWFKISWNKYFGETGKIKVILSSVILSSVPKVS